jgi:hypothetical protein
MGPCRPMHEAMLLGPAGPRMRLTVHGLGPSMRGAVAFTGSDRRRLERASGRRWLLRLRLTTLESRRPRSRAATRRSFIDLEMQRSRAVERVAQAVDNGVDKLPLFHPGWHNRAA